MYYDMFKKLCEEKNVKPSNVSKATGIPTSTLTNWKKGKFTPKIDKLQKIADYFNVPLSYLTSDSSEIPEAEKPIHNQLKEDEAMKTGGFYMDQDALDMMEFLAKRPEYKVLFKSAKNVRPEDIELAAKVLDKFKDDDQYTE